MQTRPAIVLCALVACSAAPGLACGRGSLALHGDAAADATDPCRGGKSEDYRARIGVNPAEIDAAVVDAPPPFACDREAPVVALPFGVNRAAYSRQLDRLVLVSQRQLHIVSPETCAETVLTLPMDATALALSPNGLTAAVAHQGWITAVDLQAGAILRSTEVPQIAPLFSSSDDVAIDDIRRAYVVAQAQYANKSLLLVVDVLSGAIAAAAAELEGRGNVSLAPTGGTLFYGSAAYTNDGYIARLDVTGPTPKLVRERKGAGNCGPLYVADDGASLYSLCNQVVSTSDDGSLDLRALGGLEGTMRIKHVATHATSGRVVIIRRPTTVTPDPTSEPDDAIHVYDSASRKLVKDIPLPGLPPITSRCDDAQTPDAAHAQWVFIPADGRRYYVIAGSYAGHTLMRLAP